MKTTSEKTPESAPKKTRDMREVEYRFGGTRVTFEKPGDYAEGHFAEYGPFEITDRETKQPKPIPRLVLVKDGAWRDNAPHYDSSDSIVIFPGADLAARVEYALGISELVLETGEVVPRIDKATGSEVEPAFTPGTFVRITFIEEKDIGRPSPVKVYKVEQE